ncbi:MAG: hypothetical protein CV090_02205 [Nitrospira sp. WS238]|nr:hypothetical protein [Nitrospira sp. WS238]
MYRLSRIPQNWDNSTGLWIFCRPLGDESVANAELEARFQGNWGLADSNKISNKLLRQHVVKIALPLNEIQRHGSIPVRHQPRTVMR